MSSLFAPAAAERGQFIFFLHWPTWKRGDKSYVTRSRKKVQKVQKKADNNSPSHLTLRRQTQKSRCADTYHKKGDKNPPNLDSSFSTECTSHTANRSLAVAAFSSLSLLSLSIARPTANSQENKLENVGRARPACRFFRGKPS